MLVASSPTRQHIDLRDLGGAVRRCSTQKIGYRTRDDALTAAERMMEAGKVRPGCHMTPYVCEECGEFHVANRIIVFLPELK